MFFLGNEHSSSSPLCQPKLNKNSPIKVIGFNILYSINSIKSVWGPKCQLTPIQSTAQIKWNVVKVKQVQDTKWDKTKRWYRVSNCCQTFYQTEPEKQTYRQLRVHSLKLRYWGLNSGISPLSRIRRSLSFLLDSLQLLLHLFTVAVLVSVTMKSQKTSL